MEEIKIKKSGIEKVQKNESTFDYFYVKYDEGKEESRTKKYAIDLDKKIITIYTSGENLNEIKLIGFSKLPKDLVHEKGYLQQGLTSLIEYRLNKFNYKIEIENRTKLN